MQSEKRSLAGGISKREAWSQLEQRLDADIYVIRAKTSHSVTYNDVILYTNYYLHDRMGNRIENDPGWNMLSGKEHEELFRLYRRG